VEISKKIVDEELLLAEDKKDFCCDGDEKNNIIEPVTKLEEDCVEKNNNSETLTKLEEKGVEKNNIEKNNNSETLTKLEEDCVKKKNNSETLTKVKSEQYLNKKTDSTLRCSSSETEIIKSRKKLLSSSSSSGICSDKNNDLNFLFEELKLTTQEEIIDEPPSTLKLLGLIKTNNNISKRPMGKLFGKKKRKIKKKKIFFKICEINGK
jgi:hypothetical protein